MGRSTEEADESLRNGSVLYEGQYNPDASQGLVLPILEAVAMLDERPVEALRKDPLADTVDIEAVETLLFGPQQSDVTNAERRTVTFEHAGYQVHIHGDGRIILSAADDIEE